MATPEERITALERTWSEYRPILQSITFELTMVKGLVVEQVGITQQLKRDVNELKLDVADVQVRLTRLEERFEDRLEQFGNRLARIEELLIKRLGPS